MNRMYSPVASASALFFVVTKSSKGSSVTGPYSEMIACVPSVLPVSTMTHSSTIGRTRSKRLAQDRGLVLDDHHQGDQRYILSRVEALIRSISRHSGFSRRQLAAPGHWRTQPVYCTQSQ